MDLHVPGEDVHGEGDPECIRVRVSERVRAQVEEVQKHVVHQLEREKETSSRVREPGPVGASAPALASHVVSSAVRVSGSDSWSEVECGVVDHVEENADESEVDSLLRHDICEWAVIGDGDERVRLSGREEHVEDGGGPEDQRHEDDVDQLIPLVVVKGT